MIKKRTDPASGYIQTSLMFGNVVLAEGSLQESIYSVYIAHARLPVLSAMKYILGDAVGRRKINIGKCRKVVVRNHSTSRSTLCLSTTAHAQG
jgi:hypothetical protein